MLMNSSVLLAFNFKLLEELFTEPKVPTDPAAQALQDLWKIAMEGNLYGLVTGVGLLVAVIASSFWSYRLFKAFKEDDGAHWAKELVYPVLLVIFMGNGADGLKTLTLGTRDIMNSINSSINIVIDADVSIRSASLALSNDRTSQAVIARMYRQCVAAPDLVKMRDCANTTRILVNAYTDGLAPATEGSSNAKFKAQLDKFTKKMKDRNEARYNQVIAETRKLNEENGTSDPIPANPALREPNKQIGVLDSGYYENDQALESINNTIMSARIAYLYILELMWIVDGLIGPIFVGLSLFPVGTKPVVAWGVSFVSFGFCKICYTLISGLASIAFVYAGPDNINGTAVAIVLGILAPVLSFSIASGTGLSAFTAVSTSATIGNIGTGLGDYNPFSKK
jgi:hypothetical protein